MAFAFCHRWENYEARRLNPEFREGHCNDNQTDKFCDFPTLREKKTSIYLVLSAWEGLRNYT